MIGWVVPCLKLFNIQCSYNGIFASDCSLCVLYLHKRLGCWLLLAGASTDQRWRLFATVWGKGRNCSEVEGKVEVVKHEVEGMQDSLVDRKVQLSFCDSLFNWRFPCSGYSEGYQPQDLPKKKMAHEGLFIIFLCKNSVAFTDNIHFLTYCYVIRANWILISIKNNYFLFQSPPPPPPIQ